MEQNANILDVAHLVVLAASQKGIGVTPLKLQKLLYYQQSWHLVYFGEENTLFAVAPHAWVNGPVYPVIYHEYKDKVPGMCDHLKLSHFVPEGTDPMAEMKRLVEKMGLTSDEVELTERVIMLYGSKTQNQLILLTHSEKPWSEMREGMAPYEYSDKEMSLSTMYHYYKERYDRNRAKN